MPVYENINRQVVLVFKQKNRTPLSEDCAASFSVIHELQIRDYTTNRVIITENSRITTTFFNSFHSPFKIAVSLSPLSPFLFPQSSALTPQPSALIPQSSVLFFSLLTPHFSLLSPQSSTLTPQSFSFSSAPHPSVPLFYSFSLFSSSLFNSSALSPFSSALSPVSSPLSPQLCSPHFSLFTFLSPQSCLLSPLSISCLFVPDTVN